MNTCVADIHLICRQSDKERRRLARIGNQSRFCFQQQKIDSKRGADSSDFDFDFGLWVCELGLSIALSMYVLWAILVPYMESFMKLRLGK